MNVDIGAMWATPRRCPGCGELALQAVVDGEQTHFECTSCKQLWHLELGYATPVERAERRPLANGSTGGPREGRG